VAGPGWGWLREKKALLFWKKEAKNFWNATRALQGRCQPFAMGDPVSNVACPGYAYRRA
jgi:hypothetical protein